MAAQQAADAQARQSALAALLDAGRSCLDQGQLDCAADRAAQVLAQDAANAEAIALQQSVRLSREERERNAKLVSGLVGEAQACYDRRDYSCAIAKADSALAIQPDSAAARSVRDKATTAKGNAKKSISIR